MPVTRLFSPGESPRCGGPGELADAVAELPGIPAGHCWIWEQRRETGSFHRPQWRETGGPAAPAGFVVCEETYSTAQVGSLLRLLGDRLAALLGVAAEDVHLVVQRAVR